MCFPRGCPFPLFFNLTPFRVVILRFPFPRPAGTERLLSSLVGGLPALVALAATHAARSHVVVPAVRAVCMIAGASLYGLKRSWAREQGWVRDKGHRLLGRLAYVPSSCCSSFSLSLTLYQPRRYRDSTNSQARKEHHHAMLSTLYSAHSFASSERRSQGIVYSTFNRFRASLLESAGGGGRGQIRSKHATSRRNPLANFPKRSSCRPLSRGSVGTGREAGCGRVTAWRARPLLTAGGEFTAA